VSIDLEQHGPAPAQTPADAPGRLLLVDDSLLTVDVVSELMRDHGWEVATADTGAQALVRVAQFSPEVVVCDLNMPDLNGLEVSRRIHEIDGSVPVIMLSSEDRLESVLASMHAGVFDFVQKKDCMHTLPGAAGRAAAHCRVMRENRRLNDHLLAINEALEQRVAEQTALLQEKMRRAAALETAAAVAPLKKELEIAQQIQVSILPRRLDVPGLQISAHMIPAAVVGGDYYDVRPQADGCWIGIGDVSGHGLTAGLLMMMIQSGIAALTLSRPEAQPHELLPHLNRMLWENIRERLERDDFATLCLLRYFRDGRLLHAGAHEDILVCPAGAGPCQRIAAPGTWLGGVRDIAKVTTTGRLDLADGDTVVLFTDGITEARATDRTFYGLDRLCALIEKHRDLPVGQLQELLMSDVLSFTPNPEDDLTLVVMRHNGPGGVGALPTLNSGS
jgi:serine phosphatase RsbU (regulator of sigma subunit)